MIRNNPELIFKGVNARKSRAALAGNTEKWFKLDAFSWDLFWKLVK